MLHALEGHASAHFASSFALTAGQLISDSVDANMHPASKADAMDHARSPRTPLPPSPIPPVSASRLRRPSAPTPAKSTTPELTDDACPHQISDQPSAGPLDSTNSPLFADSPVSIAPTTSSSQARQSPRRHPSLAYRTTAESWAADDASPSPESSMISRPPNLPDPSNFPDPYPFNPAQLRHASTPPGLSSADSSSASTRSSAYTSFGSALAQNDYIHIRSGSDEADPSSGMSLSEEVTRLMTKDATASLNSADAEKRWSGSESGGFGLRSRASSMGRPTYETMGAVLRPKPSYDASWQPVNERDEYGMTSEEDTDDELIGVEEEEEDEDRDLERTAAIVTAEEGRGLIVKGEGVPIQSLKVEPGTTHLMIGSSSTPNTLPSFLIKTLPQISHSLLALDISANFLVSLPPALTSCALLEELNISSNPLRTLPIFLTNLVSLRLLMADSTGITTLPPQLSALDKLQTLTLRRNKMNSLPSWLCMLHSLQILFIDGNPFQGPWKALVDPLLNKDANAPLFTPATPGAFSISSSTATSFMTGTDTDEGSDPPSANHTSTFNPVEEEDTIMPARMLSRTHSTAASADDTSSIASGLSRRKTTPNRMPLDKPRSPPTSYTPTSPPRVNHNLEAPQMRKMKSTGELRSTLQPLLVRPQHSESVSMQSSPMRPLLAHSATSMSSTELLQTSPPSKMQRFGSVGASSVLSSASRTPSRPAVDQSLWDNISDEEREGESQEGARKSRAASIVQPNSPPLPRSADPAGTIKASDVKGDKDKQPRWRFLKKMSMGKLKDSAVTIGRTQSRQTARPTLSRPGTSIGLVTTDAPQIDVRLSTTGTLVMETHASPELVRKQSYNALSLGPPPTAGGLLSPVPPITPRSAKRRSFLPIDAPSSLASAIGSVGGPGGASSSLNIPIPAASSFLPAVTAANGADDDAARTPSPTVSEAFSVQQRRQDERIREAYARALRSVMAYLRDMNDLSLPQAPPKGIGISPIPSNEGSTRSRRPTLAENGRQATDSSILSDGTDVSMMSGASSHLRGPDQAVRQGASANTTSMASTDSGDSGGKERKYKDDKSKRAMIVREIIETERTYVKGLQELVDIYIKPASAFVNLITGASSKETIVPVAERKVVFGGIESLFSFHKESFLPSLEKVAEPLIGAGGAAADEDGNLSTTVARTVATTFVMHAAFMRMYSTYINNFDNSVQRIKNWTTERTPLNIGTPTSSGPATSSTAHLAGVALSMSAVSSPGVIADSGSAHNQPRLSSGQRKRVKQYLKRCRMNPRHSQLNLEGYLLLPVQRIPRYKLLLEELRRSTVPTEEYMEDPLDRAVGEISSLATNMNEGKRESESRSKLVHWQTRIRGRFPSPLVQPHRRLIMDGPLRLTRVVRKTTVAYEVVNHQGDLTIVHVDCLAPEMTPRALMGILCNDLLVLCRDPTEGQDPTSHVDLWAVLRMQTLPQPASIVHGNVLRIVDNKAVLYFDAPSASDALNWYRAINIHIPASKT